MLRFRIWTGYFFAVVPVRIDWIAARLGPAWRCYRLTAQGPKPQCEFPVEAERQPQEKDLTFARLQTEPEEGFGVEHVVIRKDSRVEVLGGAGEVVWDEGPDSVGFRVAGDLWLKVRIDGREGWIHTDEDFEAIGLSAAG